jgi:hypothetical protein
MAQDAGDVQAVSLDHGGVSERPARIERRRRTRVEVHWPVFFAQPPVDELVESVTRNLSSNGFYCTVNAVFVPGEIRECTLVVPTRSPVGQPLLPVLCKVRVVRVETAAKCGYWGIGFCIEDYRILHPAAS